MNMEAKLGLDVFALDPEKEPHIVVNQEVCRTRCRRKTCLAVCPAHLYSLAPNGDVLLNTRAAWSAAPASWRARRAR